MRYIQDAYAPKSVCFGCGPANRKGLRIKTTAEGDYLVTEWKPRSHHHAFDGVLNGGIIGTILDCHSNWAAAYSLMKRTKAKRVPATVTAEYSVKLHRPTPMGRKLRLETRSVKVRRNRVIVETALCAGQEITATFRGTFVAVGEKHPAFSRWT